MEVDGEEIRGNKIDGEEVDRKFIGAFGREALSAYKFALNSASSGQSAITTAELPIVTAKLADDDVGPLDVVVGVNTGESSDEIPEEPGTRKKSKIIATIT